VAPVGDSIGWRKGGDRDVNESGEANT
jgi:hypothetical protein